MSGFADWLELAYGNSLLVVVPFIISATVALISSSESRIPWQVLLATVISVAVNLIALTIIAGDLGWAAFLLSGFILCANFAICLIVLPLTRRARRRAS